MEQNHVPSAIADNKDGMTSLEIAEVTGKQHFNVMRDIRNILAQENLEQLVAQFFMF